MAHRQVLDLSIFRKFVDEVREQRVSHIGISVRRRGKRLFLADRSCPGGYHIYNEKYQGIHPECSHDEIHRLDFSRLNFQITGFSNDGLSGKRE